MTKLALAAAIAAALTTTAYASEDLVSTVVAVNAKANTLTLTDKSVMTVAKEVDLSAVKPGMKVAIAARLDEDGYAPATKVTPQQ